MDCIGVSALSGFFYTGGGGDPRYAGIFERESGGVSATGVGPSAGGVGLALRFAISGRSGAVSGLRFPARYAAGAGRESRGLFRDAGVRPMDGQRGFAAGYFLSRAAAG